MGFSTSSRDQDDRSIALDAIDGFARQLARLGSAVARIGKINPPLGVEAEVVRRIEPLPLVPIGQRFALAGFEVPSSDAAAAAIRAVARQQVSVPIEGQSVGLARIVGEDRGLHRLRVETKDHAVVFAEGHVGEIDLPIGSGGGAFGQTRVEFHLARVEQLQFGVRGDDWIFNGLCSYSRGSGPSSPSRSRVWVQASRSMPVRASSQPGGVDREDAGREPAEAGVLAAADAVLDAGVGAVAGLQVLDRPAAGAGCRWR